jgi:hypothetical protein
MLYFKVVEVQIQALEYYIPKLGRDTSHPVGDRMMKLTVVTSYCYLRLDGRTRRNHSRMPKIANTAVL